MKSSSTICWLRFGPFLVACLLLQSQWIDSPPLPAAEPQPPTSAANREVEAVMQNFKGRGALGDGSLPMTPEQALQQFRLADGLEIDLLAAEPEVMQPVYLSFDAKGRMWVVQYLQYPFPAGLKVTRYDQYLRAVFDDVPRPPPHHVKGKDRVSVFEDTDGDGKYDSSRVVIDGLNIATAALAGRGGIWVMNTPYLLFYPDANEDGIPDGDPVVHLSGFGLEDTHAVANSLAWGPDGWLYGAMGSTTTATVSSKVSKNVAVEGQHIWRYHPETTVFEVFGEGGGNTFSVEFDKEGRLFSGTNHGSTRGMFYPQGSFGEKNFGKHGPLTNPYAFGYFHHMKHQGDQVRFPQTFVIYEGGTLPEIYDKTVIAANALHHRVWGSELQRDGSTYRTTDLPVLCDTKDTWFRPVDIKVGPDGALYLADWYDTRLTHVDPRDNWHKESGRLYRIQGKSASDQKLVDLTKVPNSELIVLFSHPNKWQRFTASRVLADRLRATPESAESQTTLKQLHQLLTERASSGLEALWTLHSAHQIHEQQLGDLLSHPNPDVRRWSVRLLGDDRVVTPSTGRTLAALAQSEQDVQVRSQLASSAKRFTTSVALPILQSLINHDEDAKDPHLPLLIWWALEGHCGTELVQRSAHIGVALAPEESIPPRDQVFAMIASPEIWEKPIFRDWIAKRLMQRFALDGIRQMTRSEDPTALATCERLLSVAPARMRPVLMAGFLESYHGRKMTSLPAGLQQAISAYQQSLGETDIVLGVRLGQQESIDQALALIANEKGDLSTRLMLIETFGGIEIEKAVPVLVRLLKSPSNGIKRAALQALTRYSNPQIGEDICGACHSTLTEEDGLREAAYRVLATREPWTEKLLNEFEKRRLVSTSVPVDVVQQMRLHANPKVQARIDHLWGKSRLTSAEKVEEMERLRQLLLTPPTAGPDEESQLAEGRKLFTQRCAACHTLFAEGGQTGPNLTGYERTNLDFLLLAISDPSAGIREEYTQFQVVTEDGRVMTGLITDRNASSITLRSADGKSTNIPLEDIETLQAMSTSMMPEGLLKDLTEAQTLSLFRYLMSRTPPSSLDSAPQKP
ncbi:PVC-type heme-binding CxxCH protein [Planctomicrobium sp. SH664]|uniref:PVC-type heme-binding CxxCH protein n=1 Tax=Planctomicrobium sp. SH664 TaxID=3448125 RepID=UPI003F5BB8F2